MKNKIILVAGCLAAGKSTFSLKLSQYLSIPCFNKDNVKEVVADGMGQQSDVFKKGSAITYDILFYIAERLLQSNQPCILESNFRFVEGERIKQLLERFDCECLTFTFGGNLDVFSRRYLQREPERHWVHMKSENDQTIKNYAIDNKLAEFSVGQTVYVDATDFDNIDYDALFATAKQFVEN